MTSNTHPPLDRVGLHFARAYAPDTAHHGQYAALLTRAGPGCFCVWHQGAGEDASDSDASSCGVGRWGQSKRGLSAQDKKTKMLELLHETRDFFQLKDLEKIAPKSKGIGQ